jgi:hypothetical protein
MSSDELEIIKERYESAKKLAQELWLDGDNEGTPNDFYYFQCGFVAGMNYQNNERYKSQKKRLEALQRLSDYDQELGLQ